MGTGSHTCGCGFWWVLWVCKPIQVSTMGTINFCILIYVHNVLLYTNVIYSMCVIRKIKHTKGLRHICVSSPVIVVSETACHCCWGGGKVVKVDPCHTGHPGHPHHLIIIVIIVVNSWWWYLGGCVCVGGFGNGGGVVIHCCIIYSPCLVVHSLDVKK